LPSKATAYYTQSRSRLTDGALHGEEDLVRCMAVVLTVTSCLVPGAFGWDAQAHRCITYLALDGLPPEAPGWLRDPGVRHQIAFQSSQADRWRGWRAVVLTHENDPEHYLDIELLSQFGLTLKTVPPLRAEYVRVMAVSKHLHPEWVDPYEASEDPARVREWPGFLLHAMTEHYVKLEAAFNQLRILETLNEPARKSQLQQARSIAIYHLGLLSHFVADAAQPLHTTKHFNGWVGDNPAEYTTSKELHAYVDGGVIEHHALTYAKLKAHVKYGCKIDARDPWNDLVAHVRRANARVEPLYRLERDGELDRNAGRAFIVERLTDATALLSAMIWAAYTNAEPTARQISSWVYYNNFKPEVLPGMPESTKVRQDVPEDGP